MATNLHDLSIGAPDDGFAQLLHINGGITGALKTVYDGDATATIVELSSAAFNITGAGTFQYGGVAVSSTAAELNILDGATVNATELNYLDGTTLGTAVASKVLACDASKDLNLGTGDLTATNLTGTLQTAAQTNITTVGTLTTLTVDNITINGSTISATGDITIDSTGAGINLDTHTDAGDDLAVNTSMLVVSGDSGDVGIGTASPVSRLDISTGDQFLVSNTLLANIYLGQIGGAQADNNYGGSISFGRINSAQRAFGAIAGVQTGSNANEGGLAFFTHPGVTPDNTVVEQMRIDGNGNLGIGTISPLSILHLGTATEELEFVDAGSAGATEQDWIEVEVGGNQGFIRVYAAI